jgi:hypothetical protein
MVTVDFRSKGARTDVVITHELLPTAAAAASHTKGWSGVLEWLDRTIGAAPAS